MRWVDVNFNVIACCLMTLLCWWLTSSILDSTASCAENGVFTNDQFSCSLCFFVHGLTDGCTLPAVCVSWFHEGTLP